MNSFYSPPVQYRDRWITPQLQDAMTDHPVIVLTGARQVGKSTLLLNAHPFRDWCFYTMDDLDVLRQANQDPEALWAGTDRSDDDWRSRSKGGASYGLILYGGAEIRRMGDNIVAVPWTLVTG